MSKHRMERSKVPFRTMVKYWRYRAAVVLVNMRAKIIK
jgi:hypothetical protein